ncbi:tRNA pseudouridine(38-40) synthase TruA [Acholeplasma sp. OttesenSCG-928-E16]|nr:tRNA pseudouridine(38-40) synthase TruA [Acholeplasma sp. OttesenSCG-928-E16]
MRYLAIVEYDGTNYSGFQSQKNANTIQDAIEKAFRLMTQTEVKIYGSGRTDKGVHAIGQTFHFDSDLNIDIETWEKALNKRLPGDIRIKKIIKKKNSFHARHSAKSKIYKYIISKRELSAFEYNHMVYIEKFDLSLAKLACEDLVGTHDFIGLSQYVLNKPTIKTIYSVNIKETKDKITFFFHGNAFLKYMVRSIMGTLIEIATKRKPVNQFNIIFEQKLRSLAGKTASPKGLYLVKVFY